MFFNDNNAFNMAEQYSKNNNINYDYYMKFRSDIINTTMPKIELHNNNILYSIVPSCNFISHGIFKTNIVSDAWVWGNYETMKKYCNTYYFVLDMLNKYNGNYYIAFEDCVTDNVYSNNIPIIYVNHSYRLDKNRRIFDIAWEKNADGIVCDTRIHNIHDSHEYVDIKTLTDTSHIKVVGII